MRVLIAGLTARAAGESAVRAGCDVVTVDYFGDLDTKRLAPNVSLRERGGGYSAAALARIAGELRHDAVAYCGGLENHPDVVDELARGKVLLGNTGDTLRRVRDPVRLFPTLAAHGFAVPATHVSGRRRAARGRRWLVKPAAGGGGRGIRVWRGERVGPGHIVQEYVVGLSASAVFVADGRHSVLLGWSEQLRTARGFRYRGNVLPLGAPPAALEEIRRLIHVLTAEFGLVGLNGVDFVLRDGRPVPLEVNPRYSASMELVDRAAGVALFGLHVAACRGELPGLAVTAAAVDSGGAVHGKAIVYARESVGVGDSTPWIERGVRDVPHPGEVIRKAHPICTVLATAPSRADCLARLAAEEAVVLGACSPVPTVVG